MIELLSGVGGQDSLQSKDDKTVEKEVKGIDEAFQKLYNDIKQSIEKTENTNQEEIKRECVVKDEAIIDNEEKENIESEGKENIESEGKVKPDNEDIKEGSIAGYLIDGHFVDLKLDNGESIDRLESNQSIDQKMPEMDNLL